MDYTTVTVHYKVMVHITYYILQTKVPNGPFSHSWSHIIIIIIIQNLVHNNCKECKPNM